MSADCEDLMLGLEMAVKLVARKVAVKVYLRAVDWVEKMAELTVGLLVYQLDDKIMVASMVLY